MDTLKCWQQKVFSEKMVCLAPILFARTPTSLYGTTRTGWWEIFFSNYFKDVVHLIPITHPTVNKRKDKGDVPNTAE